MEITGSPCVSRPEEICGRREWGKGVRSQQAQRLLGSAGPGLPRFKSTHAKIIPVLFSHMGRRATTAEQREEGKRLAAALQAARHKSDRPQSALAKASGVSIDTIRAMEGNRVASPSFFTVARLARELEVTLDLLADRALGKSEADVEAPADG
jgi:DNA-binding XRE family transcriptional regulator